MEIPQARAAVDFFSALGVQPVVGNLFTPGDDSPDAALWVVITFGFYEQMAPNSPFLQRAVSVEDHWWVRLMARMEPAVGDARLKAAFDTERLLVFRSRPLEPANNPQTHRLVVGETFFDTMGIPILHGRGLSSANTSEASKVIVINETFARNYFPDQDPVGHSINTWRLPSSSLASASAGCSPSTSLVEPSKLACAWHWVRNAGTWREKLRPRH